jgi:Cu2+-exporting ATPase
MHTQKGEVLVGSGTFLIENGIDLPPVESGALTEVYVSLSGSYCGVLIIQDPLRDESAQTISRLQQLGLNTVLLTGDRAETASQVSTKLAIPVYRADFCPSGKAEWVEAQQQSGRNVMMVGDGINDAPALSVANVGCAMAGGTDIALETSDLVLTRPDLGRLYEAIFIARKTLQVIKQNLFWAFTYNLITIPLAASGTLAPVWAAVTMASSSLLVVGNSLRLGRLVRRTFSVAKQPTGH